MAAFTKPHEIPVELLWPQKVGNADNPGNSKPAGCTTLGLKEEYTR